MRKCPRPKFKLGDKVYSYQNPTVKAPIIDKREARGPPPYCLHKYRMRLRTKTGSRNSHWTNESSLSKRRKRK